MTKSLYLTCHITISFYPMYMSHDHFYRKDPEVITCNGIHVRVSIAVELKEEVHADKDTEVGHYCKCIPRK